MFNLIWIPATIMAAGFQVARNAVQRSLLPSSGPWAATLVRFLFGLPFSLLFSAVAFALTAQAGLHFNQAFWMGAVVGAITQVLATAALLVAMHRAGFAIGTAVQQCSLPLSGVLGWMFYDTPLGPMVWAGILVSSVGLAILTWPKQVSLAGPKPVSGALFGVLSGASFGMSLNAFREAGLQLDPQHPVFSALTTVAIVQAMQIVGLVAYLSVRDRAALRFVLTNWRQSIGAGLFGAIASSGWFAALALAPSASAVRAVGVIETPIAAAAARRVFKERLRPMQVIAGSMVLVGVIVTVLG